MKEKKMKTLQDKIWVIIEYAPHVLTVLFGAYVGLEASRGAAKPDQMLQWILIILLLIATTQLMERSRSLRIIRSNIELLPASIMHRSTLFSRESEEIGFRVLAQNASTIDIVGWSCSWFFEAHDGFLQGKLSSGCCIRMIIASSDGAAAKVIMDNSRNKALISDIEKAKTKAAHLCETHAGKPGTFEMKEVDWVTPWGAVLINRAKSDGVASIGFHPIFLPTPLDSRRFALVDAATALSDFTYFRDQFEGLWNSERAKAVCATSQSIPPNSTAAADPKAPLSAR